MLNEAWRSTEVALQFDRAPARRNETVAADNQNTAAEDGLHFWYRVDRGRRDYGKSVVKRG